MATRLMRCQACGGSFRRAERCPSCGAATRAGTAAGGQTGLLLPSGPLGALLAIVITGLLFAGIWVAFDRATGDRPGLVGAPAPSLSDIPTPMPTPAPDPSPTPTAATPTPTTAASPDPAEAWTPVLQEADRGLVRVVGVACDNTRIRGTGFLVGPRRVVTAAHLLADASRVRVRRGDRVRSARILGRNPDLDLALLAIDERIGPTTLDLVERPVAIGQRVAAAGLDRGPMVVPGTVSGVDVTVMSRRGRLDGVVRTDAHVDSLLAGAPLLATSGRVGGVVLADHVTSTVAGLGFALPAAVVAEHVNRWTDARPRPPRSCPGSSPDARSPDGPSPDGPSPDARSPDARSPDGRSSDAPSEPPAPEQQVERLGWVAILESLPDTQFDRGDARRRAQAYRDRIGQPTRVLHSSDWSSLNPGYWVIYTGPHGDLDGSRAACGDYGPSTPTCYPREVLR